MKLEINLNDEPNFLNEIKKFIMEHVKGIARSEFEKQIKSVFAEKLNSVFPKDDEIKNVIAKFAKDELQRMIKEALIGGSYGNQRDEIRKIIREEIATQVKEMLDKKQF